VHRQVEIRHRPHQVGGRALVFGPLLIEEPLLELVEDQEDVRAEGVDVVAQSRLEAVGAGDRRRRTQLGRDRVGDGRPDGLDQA
jgi:hypothetical protein